MGAGVYETGVGRLSLMEDGVETIKKVAERAWEEWLWKQEPRVRKSEVFEQELRGREPCVVAQWGVGARPKIRQGGG